MAEFPFFIWRLRFGLCYRCRCRRLLPPGGFASRSSSLIHRLGGASGDDNIGNSNFAHWGQRNDLIIYSESRFLRPCALLLLYLLGWLGLPRIS